MQRLPVNTFSTDAWAPHQRHDAWLHRHWPSYAAAAEARPDGAFEARTQDILLGSIALFYGRYAAQTLWRSAGQARRDGIDHVGLCFNLGGELTSDDATLRPGALLLTDLTREFRHHSSAARFITVALPRSQVIGIGADPRQLHARVVDGPRVALLRAHLLGIRRSAPHLTVQDGPPLLRTMIDLVQVALRGGGLAAPPSDEATASAHRLRVRDFVERHLGNPNLTSAAICRQLGLSRSTLYRLFDQDGGIHTHIRQRRLDLARAALLDPANHDPIATIAERHGFGDPAYFSRVFRQRFGQAPRDSRDERRHRRDG